MAREIVGARSRPLDLDAIARRQARAWRWLVESMPDVDPDETNEQTGDRAALITLVGGHVPAMLSRLREVAP